MALKIRLRLQGKNRRPFYRLVVTDCHTRRDGKYVEMVGWYDPLAKENNLSLDGDRIRHWMGCGATLSEKAKILVQNSIPDIVLADTARVIARRAKVQAVRRTRRKKLAAKKKASAN